MSHRRRLAGSRTGDLRKAIELRHFGFQLITLGLDWGKKRRRKKEKENR